jgi:hypothetical protein
MQTPQVRALAKPGYFIFMLLMSIVSTACTAMNTAARDCPVTEPTWAKPPEDSAVQNAPAYGYYFVNEDRSMWASAWRTEQEENYLRAGEDIKMGWFRPAGAGLEITGQRLDGEAYTLETHIPCCYPTRFQATGLVFPTEGCWEVNATAEDRQLSFVVWVGP